MSRSEDPCTAGKLFEWPLSVLPTQLDWPARIALRSGDLHTLARRPKYASSFTSSGQTSREGGTSGVPAMSIPE
eukprot:1573046-Pleurochrysis_carterae.AAC.1